jgi:ATP-dependent DNA helicase RecQ
MESKDIELIKQEFECYENNVHTYEETERSDDDWIARGKPSIEKGRPFADKWTDEAKTRGYIYLIDFSGYGKK